MKRIATRVSTFTVCASLSFAAPALGGGVEYLLIPNSNGGGIDVSDDGTKVLIGNTGGVASMWEEGVGFTPLGVVFIGPTGLSADGTTAVASRDIAGDILGQKWTQPDGWTDAGNVLGQCDANLSSAWAVNGDGSIIVGLVWETCRVRPCMWVNGVLDLLDWVDNDSARASAIADDSSLMGGWQQLSTRSPCVWDPDGTQTLLAPTDVGEVYGVNSDGTVACGTVGQQAFKWSPGDDGIELLPPVTGGQSTTFAKAISTNGNVAVGWTGSFPNQPRAALWTPQIGGQDLRLFLIDNGIDVGTTTFQFAQAVTPDGRTIVGSATDNGRQVAFRIILPEITSETICPGAADDFASTFGGPVNGDALDLCASDDTRLEVLQSARLSPLLPFIRLEYWANTSIGDNPVVSVDYTIECHVSAFVAGGQNPKTLQTRIRNYATGLFELVDERGTSANTDEVINHVQTTNAPDYVNAGDGEIRVRQDVFDPGNVISPNWFLKVDLYEVVVDK